MSEPLRVAAYCRVSTGKEDQAGSLQSQRAWFRDYIAHRPGWTLVDVYADEGATGTSTRCRAAFNRMIADAEAGRLDLILTKEVSRFARNTVDALAYTRRLSALGVGVVFLTDNIDTRQGDGELRLTIMASIAQEESRKTSERVKWGQKRRMEAGVVFGNDTLYGYRLRGGILTVDEPQAAVVRLVYRKYLHEGKGTHVIARELTEAGIPPPQAPSGSWSPATVHRLLTGEKYVGDLRCKKHITVDYLTHKKVPNRGREAEIYLRDHHPAIIDRPTWEAVQAELARRRRGRDRSRAPSARHWCSGKLRCCLCGSTLVPRAARRKNGEPYLTWVCRSRLQNGAAACPLPMVNQKVLTACADYLLDRLPLDLDALAGELARRILALGPARDPAGSPAAQKALLERKKRRLLDAYLDGAVTREELARLRAPWDAQLARLEAQPAGAASPPPDLLPRLRALLRSDALYRALVSSVAVRPGRLDFTLSGISRPFPLAYSTSGAGKGYTVTVRPLESDAVSKPSTP